MEINEVEAQGPPWKLKHEGIPPSWTHMGDGGNAHVWRDGTHAIKRLRPDASKEPVARFAREAKLLKALTQESDLAIVPVFDVRKRAGEIEIVMEAFEGNLAAVIGEFAGQPEKAAIALLPIVDTLGRMAARSQPIHHRDIKPENLLYRRPSGEIQLALSDFGCAYLAEDERLTPTHRAIGAWAYRPPEYSIGRVVNVDEKGDVFSLGKVFWAMLNGERHVVFPGPVWFLEEFDLARRFPDTPKIHHAMVIIARACDIRPDQRPTLAQLADNLGTLIAAPTEVISLKEDERSAAMLRSEALRETAYQQRRAIAAQFVCAIHNDFLRAIEALHDSVTESALFREWSVETKRCGQSQHALVSQVADQESDAPVSNVFYRKTLLNTRFYPAHGSAPIKFAVRTQALAGQVPESVLTISGTNAGLLAEYAYANGSIGSKTYQEGMMADFLREAAVHLP